MHHAMANSIYFIQTLDNTNLWICQQREDELYALSMLRDLVIDLLLFTIGQLNLYKSTVQANTLSTTTGHHTLIVHIVQSVLDR